KEEKLASDLEIIAKKCEENQDIASQAFLDFLRQKLNLRKQEREANEQLDVLPAFNQSYNSWVLGSLTGIYWDPSSEKLVCQTGMSTLDLDKIYEILEQSLEPVLQHRQYYPPA